MAACPHCNASNEDGSRFCGTCGKATVKTESHPGGPRGNDPFDQADPYAAMIGKEIAGRYRITKKLGEGGMGAVFRAEQVSLKRACAVKLLRPGLMANEQALRRFNAEAQAVAKLSHPNTIDIYDFGQDTDGSLFIAMEFVEGKSLRDVIIEEGPLQFGRALAIASQIASSLTDAHANSVIHRDLKPDNVMLSVRGKQKDVVHVLDFGIAKLRDDNASKGGGAAMTQAGDMLGTPQYMAPEQIRGETIDGRVDVYALGCIVYEMVTGRIPHEGESVLTMLTKALSEDVEVPSRRRPELRIPPALDALIMAALQKEPTARPASMELFGEQIGAVFAQLPPEQRGTSNTSGGLPIVTVSTQQPAPLAAITEPPAFAPTAPMTPLTPLTAPPPITQQPPQTGIPMMAPYGTPAVPPTTLPPYVAPQPPKPAAGGNTGMIVMIAVVVVFIVGIIAFVKLRYSDVDPNDPNSFFKFDKTPPSSSTPPTLEEQQEQERERSERARDELIENLQKEQNKQSDPDN